MIITEGCDGTGKTVLAKAISAKFGGEYIHSPGPVGDLGDWILGYTLAPLSYAKAVFDRFYFSELVYGPIFRGQVAFTRDTQAFYLGRILAGTPMVIFCTRKRQEVMNYIRKTKHEIPGAQVSWTPPVVLEVLAAYDKLARGLAAVYPYCVEYDFGVDSQEDIMGQVQDYFTEVYSL